MKKQFMHRATKNATRNFGDSIIDLIQQHLNQLGYLFLMDTTLTNNNFSTLNKVRKPDLYLHNWKGHYVNLVLELDGNVHGEDLQSATVRTKNRNKDYLRTGYNYLVFHMAELKENNFSFKEKTVRVLDLITYMVSHELNKIVLREELK